MANPRQRRKQKSGTYKPARTTNPARLRRVPTIKGPAAIKQAWDKTKSLQQNYAAMGLAVAGKPAARAHWPVAPPTVRQAPKRTSSSNESGIPKGYARILRDEDGNVIGVEESPEDMPMEEEEEVPAWEKERLNPFDSDDEDEGPRGRGDEDVEPKTAVIQALEEQAGEWVKPPRPPSTNERRWLASLVQKHGEDVDAMHRDMTLNTFQRTPGELKRA
ncbi:Nucleolar protein 16 [Tulasnella sp. 403]|nr:Nucleolar protein 16 [Tulasnella sp. 403]